MKPSIPQGTRDFTADTVRKRQYIFNTIKNVFELYGFQPLETPAMENIDTLMGKYGEEGDKLIFKILNNGLDNPAKAEKINAGFQDVLHGKWNKNVTERALRYDLTIPFARFVAMHHGQLTFPYKRYQIQPVWRADRPQRGRYREFYQCDCDVVGSHSLLNEVELIHIYQQAFKNLKVKVDIKINNRKILAALAENCNAPEKLTDITVAIDKLDKIGIEKVKEELLARDLSETQIAIIEQYLSISGSNQEKLQQLTVLLAGNETAAKGIAELYYLLENTIVEDECLQLDFTLARGLNYYTGTIFEIKARDVQMGTIGGGGRYDNLTGLFGVEGVPGVGVSFGVDRIYDVMDELQLFDADIKQGAAILFFNMGEEESRIAYRLMQQLRSKNISCEIYHEFVKLDKQFKYAEKKAIRYVGIIGRTEIVENTCIVKNIETGTQQVIPLMDIEKMSTLLKTF